MQGWLARLKEDKRLFVYASAQAQGAADYILNLKGGNNEGSANEDMATQTMVL